jgi:hypothetical protein
LDIDTRFLGPLAAERFEVLRSDVTREPLPEGQFDLVHSRLLLEQLAKRDDVLDALVDATGTIRFLYRATLHQRLARPPTAGR